MSSSNSLRVFKEIETAILSGEFKPRERLVENDFISRFKVSRTVIRDAFKMLEGRGLIKTFPFKGAVVADLTVEEIQEIYSVRAELERIAARLVLKNITKAEIQELKRLSKEAETHLRRRTYKMIEADSQFHRALFRACRNKCLLEIIDYLRKKVHFVRFNAWYSPQRIEESISEHQKLIKAIEDRNLPGLEELVVKHLNFPTKKFCD